jgi:peptidyl-prolyl cis-trans isomerase SDCCAG10
LRTKILNNPFDDIVPRVGIKSLSKDEKTPKHKSTAAATKNYSLLSFGEEAEEEEDQIDVINKKFFTGKGKSSHDLTIDPKLSTELVVVQKTTKTGDDEEDKAKAGKKRKAQKDSSSDDEDDGIDSKDDDDEDDEKPKNRSVLFL